MRIREMMLIRLLQRFASDRRGNVLMIFGLSLIPLLAAVGGAVDYSQAARSRSHMLEAANAAALAAARTAQTYMNQNGNATGAWTQAQSLAQAQYLQVFNANELGNTYASVATPGMTMALNADGSVTANVSATASIPTIFMRLVGIPTVPLAVFAQATGGGKIYYNIVFVVDTSNSMAIGGDTTTISSFQNSSVFGSCAFACHDPNSTNNLDNQNNRIYSYYCKTNNSQYCTGYYKTAYIYVAGSQTYCPEQGTSAAATALNCVPWDDKRVIAKYLNYPLKIDAVRSAVNTFVQNLQTPMSQAPQQYQVSIWTFASQGKYSKIFPDATSGPAPTTANITAYYNELVTKSNAIDLEVATSQNLPYNHGYTYTSEALKAAMTDATSTLGNGGDTTHRKTFFIFLSDGAEDINDSAGTYGGNLGGVNRRVVTNYPTVCTSIKNTTTNSDSNTAPFIYSIEATYPPIPGDSQYNTLIGNNSALNIPSAMQSCASAGGYIPASDNASIAKAVNNVFSAITSGNLRLTK